MLGLQRPPRTGACRGESSGSRIGPNTSAKKAPHEPAKTRRELKRAHVASPDWAMGTKSSKSTASPATSRRVLSDITMA